MFISLSTYYHLNLLALDPVMTSRSSLKYGPIQDCLREMYNGYIEKCSNPIIYN